MIHAIILALAMGSIGADAYTTQQIWSHRSPREVNPIASPFMGNGSAMRAGYFAVSAGGVFLADRKFSHHHRKLVIAGELAITATEAYWVTYNVRHGDMTR